MSVGVTNAVTEDAVLRTAGRPRADEMLALIEQLYRDEAPRFRRVANAILHDADAADDVVQEAFANAVTRRRSFRGNGDAAGWLWRIVVNSALSRRRRARIEASAANLATAEVAGPADVEELQYLRAHIARLPDRQRVALFLRYYADLDYDGIAHALSIAPGTVGKLLHDARVTIEAALERRNDG